VNFFCGFIWRVFTNGEYKKAKKVHLAG